MIDIKEYLKQTKTVLLTQDAFDELKQRASAQPQITHCSECIHWKHSDVRKSYCEVFDWTNTADDFCSFTEARTDE